MPSKSEIEKNKSSLIAFQSRRIKVMERELKRCVRIAESRKFSLGCVTAENTRLQAANLSALAQCDKLQTTLCLLVQAADEARTALDKLARYVGEMHEGTKVPYVGRKTEEDTARELYESQMQQQAPDVEHPPFKDIHPERRRIYLNRARVLREAGEIEMFGCTTKEQVIEAGKRIRGLKPSGQEFMPGVNVTILPTRKKLAKRRGR